MKRNGIHGCSFPCRLQEARYPLCNPVLFKRSTLFWKNKPLLNVNQDDIREIESRLRQTANVNLYHMTKFSLNFCFIVHCFNPKISSSLRLVLSLTVVLDCF